MWWQWVEVALIGAWMIVFVMALTALIITLRWVIQR
jgi:hypothetical protein